MNGPREGDAASPGQRGPVFALLAILVVSGAALRIYGLDAQSLWNDELSSWQQSHQPTLAAVIEKGVRPDPHPPGYQALLFYVERYVGESERALRLPSVMAGVLSIVVAFLLGRQLYSEREGLIAAALFAFSYQPIYFSQEARAYALLMLFAMVTSLFWFRIQAALSERRTPGTGESLGYAISAACAMYLHYFGLLLVAIQIAGLLVLSATRSRNRTRMAALAALLAVLYLPWFPYLIEDFAGTRSHIGEPDARALYGYWRFLFYDPGEHLLWFAAALFAIAVAKAASRRLPRSVPPAPSWWTSPTVLLLAWFALPVLFAFVRSQIAAPIFTNRNLIICLPPAFLLFSRALTRTLADTRLLAVSVGAMVAVMLYGLFVSGGYYRYPRKDQFREAAAVVTAREDEYPNARIVAHAWSEGKFDYYLERQGASSRVDLLAGSALDVDRVRAY
ncbi:MAG: glycosyltransferase family 39 protein, partial [Myxococcota bacterium]